MYNFVVIFWLTICKVEWDMFMWVKRCVTRFFIRELCFILSFLNLFFVKQSFNKYINIQY